MDGVGREELQHVRQARTGEQRQADLGIGRAGQGAEAVGPDHLDVMAVGAQELGHGVDGAHHAVDLRQPGVGDDGDAQSGYSAAMRTGGRQPRQHGIAPRDLLGPVHDAQATIEVLDQRGAAFDPVAVIAVEDAIDVADLGVVDVAADHAVDAAPARFARHRVLVAVDELDRVLDLVLQVGRQRPVGQAELAAAPVEGGVDAQRRAVGPVAEDREPARIAHDAVELVAMDHQQLAAVGLGVDRLFLDLHPAEGELAVLPRRLVVVAGDVDDVGALARLAHDLLDDIVVRLRPVPPALQAPAIDNVADQVQSLALVPSQEIEQHLGLATTRAQMDIGQEDRAMAGRLVTLYHGHVDKTRPAQNLLGAIARDAADCVCRRLRARESSVTVQ